MTRIGSLFVQQSALLNLQRAKAREADAAETMATQRKATDLQGFGRDAESVTALKTVQARVLNWQSQADALAGKLDIQDAYLNETMDASAEMRSAFQEAIASDHGDGLVTRITAAFQKAANALNGTHQGEYLFAGGRLDDQPFRADTLADLTAAPSAADLFSNDTLKSEVRVDDRVVVKAGQLASEIGGPLMESFRRFQAFLQGPDGTFGKNLTEAQRTFLQGEINSVMGVQSQLTAVVARNGSAQAQVEGTQASLEDRAISLAGLLADRVEVDPFEAISELNQAQLALEATAKVFNSLKGSSLLELIR